MRAGLLLPAAQSYPPLPPEGAAASLGTVTSRIVLFLLAAAGLPLQDVPEKPGSFHEEARVERVVVDAHVIDRRGDPIPHLGVSDFRVKVDGRVVPLESVEWVPAEAPEADVTAAETLRAPEASEAPEFPPGRLLVIFFQTDYEVVRLTGLIRMALQARRFLDGLLPTDRVAVLSFDSHLKLRQDFTADRFLLDEAIDRSIRMGTPPKTEPGSFPSLARNFDFRAAKRAVTPERALELIANALQPIPGGKSMLYFGWGLGTIGGVTGPVASETREYAAALPALARARVNIFTLDVTDADYHTLEVRLQQVSDETGGSYQKTHVFPGLAMDRVRRALAGRYVLVFVKPPGRRGVHTIDVALAGRKGEVFARNYYED
jgi:VWFA-related protein